MLISSSSLKQIHSSEDEDAILKSLSLSHTHKQTNKPSPAFNIVPTKKHKLFP